MTLEARKQTNGWCSRGLSPASVRRCFCGQNPFWKHVFCSVSLLLQEKHICLSNLQSEWEIGNILLLSSSETLSVWCVARPNMLSLIDPQGNVCHTFQHFWIVQSFVVFNVYQSNDLPFSRIVSCDLPKWRRVVPAVHPQVAAVHSARGRDEHDGVWRDQLLNLQERLAHMFKNLRLTWARTWHLDHLNRLDCFFWLCFPPLIWFFSCSAHETWGVNVKVEARHCPIGLNSNNQGINSVLSSVWPPFWQFFSAPLWHFWCQETVPFRVAPCQRCSTSTQYIRLPLSYETDVNLSVRCTRCFGRHGEMEFERALFRIHQKALLTEPLRRFRLQLESILPVSWREHQYLFAVSFCIQFWNATFFAPFCFGSYWLANFSQLPSKAVIAVQVVVLATLHWCYVGRSSCLPDVFRHAGLLLV